MKRKRPDASSPVRFICPYEGCGKSFVRREHLSRHHLNHEPKEIYCCDQCPKQFIRPDLLSRHKERHRKGMHYRRSGGVVNPNAVAAAQQNKAVQQQQQQQQTSPQSSPSGNNLATSSASPNSAALNVKLQQPPSPYSLQPPPQLHPPLPHSHAPPIMKTEHHPDLASITSPQHFGHPGVLPFSQQAFDQQPQPHHPHPHHPQLVHSFANSMQPDPHNPHIPPPSLQHQQFYDVHQQQQHQHQPPAPPQYEHQQQQPSLSPYQAYNPTPPATATSTGTPSTAPPAPLHQNGPPPPPLHPPPHAAPPHSSQFSPIPVGDHPSASPQDSSSHPPNPYGFVAPTPAAPVFGDSFYSPPTGTMSYDDLNWLFSQDLIAARGNSNSNNNNNNSQQQQPNGINSSDPATYTDPQLLNQTNLSFPDPQQQQQQQQQQMQPSPTSLQSVSQPSPVSSSNNNLVPAPSHSHHQSNSNNNSAPSSATIPQLQLPPQPQIVFCDRALVNSVIPTKDDPNISAYPAPIAWANSWPIARERLANALGYNANHPFFSSLNLQRFMQIYFDNYHSHFPILHIPSCDPAKIPPLLLASIVTLGATLASEERFWLTAVEIHEKLRWLIFSDAAFLPAPLWVLQALLLTQAFEKMFSTRRHHEVAHIFHGAVITLMRRGRSYTSLSLARNEEETIEQQYYRWVEAEATKRTAFFAFIMDAQHAALFGHNPCLTCNDIRLTLPYDESLWAIQDPKQWSMAIERIPEPRPFLPTLKSLLNQYSLPIDCPAFSKFILLHGLYNVAWHVEQHEAASLGVLGGRSGASALGHVLTPPNETNGPSSTINNTGNNDNNSTTNNSSSNDNNNSNNNNNNNENKNNGFPPSARPSFAFGHHTSSLSNSPRSNLPDDWGQTIFHAIESWAKCLQSTEGPLCIDAAQPLAHMAYITVSAKVNDFHVFAGARNLLGRPLGTRDYNAANIAVRQWASSKSAQRCFHHALLLVKETVFDLPNSQFYSASHENICLRPWCLYLATLIIWAYGNVHEGPSNPPADNSQPLHIQFSNAKNYVMRMLHSLNQPDAPVPPQTNDTSSLVFVVHEALNGARWELLRDAHKTLGRLIGIGEPETYT